MALVPFSLARGADSLSAEDNNNKPTRRFANWAVVQDIVWKVSTFLDTASICRSRRVSHGFYDAVDDTVWRDQCFSQGISRLDRPFTSFQQIMRGLTMGNRVAAGEVELFAKRPVGVSIDKSSCSTSVLGTENPVVSFVAGRQHASVLLEARPEYIMPGITTNPNLPGIYSVSSPQHVFFPLAFMLPGSIVRLELCHEKKRFRVTTEFHEQNTMPTLHVVVDHDISRFYENAHFRTTRPHLALAMCANLAKFTVVE